MCLPLLTKISPFLKDFLAFEYGKIVNCFSLEHSRSIDEVVKHLTIFLLKVKLMIVAINDEQSHSTFFVFNISKSLSISHSQLSESKYNVLLPLWSYPMFGCFAKVLAFLPAILPYFTSVNLMHMF